MNILQALLMVITLAILGAIGYVFYLVGGLLAAVIFVGVGLATAFGVNYFFGGSNGSNGGNATRLDYESKGARQREE